MRSSDPKAQREPFPTVVRVNVSLGEVTPAVTIYDATTHRPFADLECSREVTITATDPEHMRRLAAAIVDAAAQLDAAQRRWREAQEVARG